MKPIATPATEKERERQRAQWDALRAHYGDIGSAALLAALVCAQRKEEHEPAAKAA